MANYTAILPLLPNLAQVDRDWATSPPTTQPAQAPPSPPCGSSTEHCLSRPKGGGGRPSTAHVRTDGNTCEPPAAFRGTRLAPPGKPPAPGLFPAGPHLQGGDVLVVELVLAVAQHERGLAHAALPEQHHLEREAAAAGRRRRHPRTSSARRRAAASHQRRRRLPWRGPGKLGRERREVERGSDTAKNTKHYPPATTTPRCL